MVGRKFTVFALLYLRAISMHKPWGGGGGGLIFGGAI